MLIIGRLVASQRDMIRYGASNSRCSQVMQIRGCGVGSPQLRTPGASESRTIGADTHAGGLMIYWTLVMDTAQSGEPAWPA